MQITLNSPVIKNLMVEARELNAVDEVEHIAHAHLEYIAAEGEGRPPNNDHHERATVIGSKIAEVIASDISYDIWEIESVTLREGDLRAAVVLREDI